jgi:hypothetical protein
VLAGARRLLVSGLGHGSYGTVIQISARQAQLKNPGFCTEAAENQHNRSKLISLFFKLVAHRIETVFRSRRQNENTACVLANSGARGAWRQAWRRKSRIRFR